MNCNDLKKTLGSSEHCVTYSEKVRIRLGVFVSPIGTPITNVARLVGRRKEEEEMSDQFIEPERDHLGENLGEKNCFLLRFPSALYSSIGFANKLENISGE